MAYKVYLNNETLIFDSSLQDDEILFTRAIVNVTAQGAGSFDFTIPPCHKCFGQFNRLKDYIDIYRDDEQILSTRVYSITDTMDGQQAISCEGLLSMLSDSVYEPETFQGTLQNLVKRILDSHNNQVGAEKAVYLGTFTVENSNVYRAYQNYETSISRLNDLLKTFGGYMMIRKNYDPSRDGTIDVGLIDVGYVDTGTQMYYLDWLDHFTTPCTQKIELTSNLLDVRKVQDSSGIATVILPLGAQDEEGNRLTIESVNAGSKVVVADSTSIAKYGYVVKSEIWDDVTIAANLKSKALDYLQACLTPKTEIKLSAVDLADAGYDVDSFRVGQMVTVKAPQVGTEPVQFACVKQNLDLLDPAQNKLELGEVRVGYVQTQSGNSSEQILMTVAKQIQKSQDVMQQAIDAATEMISGNSGGYVVLHDSDGDGYPDEILVMDTADIETAVKVWCWNNSGLGYSSQGYDGPYVMAWTIDGHFNADFITVGNINASLITTGVLNASLITTGTLSADRIRAGILQALSGSSYWNLNTGDLKLVGDLIISKNNVVTEIGTITTYTMQIVEGRVIQETATGLKVSNSSISDKSYFAIVPDITQYYAGRPSGGMARIFRWISQSSVTHGNAFYYDDQYIIDMKNDSYKYIHEVMHDSLMIYRVTRLGSNFEFSNVKFATLAHGIDDDGTAFFVFSNNQVATRQPWTGFSYENGHFYVNGTQVQLQSTSSRRYKKEIEPIHNAEIDPHKLLDLPVMQFKYKEGLPLQYTDMEDLLIPGFIAETIEDIYPAATIHNDNGDIESWDERRIIPGMLALIQEQHTEIESLKSEVAELKTLVQQLLNR